MTDLLEIREKIKLLYSRLEAFIVPFIKFLLAFIVLLTLNSKLGYMSRVDNTALVLIVALMCSFLPTGFIIFFGMVFSLLHMYALAMEVALVGLCMYLLMFLLFFRFGLKDSIVVALTPLLFYLHVPYVVPIAVGLVCGPASVVSVGCGVAVYYLLQMVVDISPAVNTLGEEEAIARIRLMLDTIMSNREMLVMIVTFAITVLVVYLIRRLSIDHAWTIAMVSGALINVVMLLVGDLIYDINISVANLLLGALLALVLAKVIEFFRFCVDYSRTEKVQFEDDEYYYYVKAVPKMAVAMSTKTVKRINTQQARTGGRSGNMGYQGRNVQEYRDSTERRVTMERTSSGGAYGSSQSSRRGDRRGGQSVTIGSIAPGDDADEVYDGLDEQF